MPQRIILHGSLAAAAALAAVGAWFLWSADIVPAWVGIPLTAKAVFILLAVIARANRVRAFTDGVATAQVDPLTRLSSPELAAKVLALEFAAAERGRDVSIVLFSIDNFPRLAIMEGGSMREKLQRGVGAVLRRRTRGMNVTARHNDEGQYLSVLSGASLQGAVTFTQRVRKDLLALKLGGPQLIVSAAVCSYEPGVGSPEAMLAKAENALAKARRSGSGQIELASQPHFHVQPVTPYAIN